MAATIKFKRGASDSTGTLAAGEPAFNTADSKFFIGTNGTNKTWVGAEIENTVTWSSASSTKLATQAAIATYYPSQVTATAPDTGTFYPLLGSTDQAGAVGVRVDSGISYNAATNALTLAGDLAVNGGDLTSTSSTFNFLSNATNSVGTLNIGPSAKTMVINVGGMEFFKYQDGSAAGRKLFASDTQTAGIEKVHIYGGYAGADAVETRELYLNSDVAVTGGACTFNTYIGSANTTTSSNPTSNVNIGTNNGLGTINLYATNTIVSNDLQVNGNAIDSSQSSFELLTANVTGLNFATTASSISIGSSVTSNSTTTIHSVPIGIGSNGATRRIGCSSTNSGNEITQIYSAISGPIASTMILDLASKHTWSSGVTGTKAVDINIAYDNLHATTPTNVVNTVNIGTATSSTSSIVNVFSNTAIKGGKELRFGDSDDTQYVAFKAPATGDLTGNTTYTLPSTIGAAGTVLKIKTGASSSAAELEWSSAATATAVTVADLADNNERNILFTDAIAAGTADVKIDVTGGNLDVGIQYNPSLNRLSTGSYRLQSGASSHWLTLAASGSQTASYTFTLPINGGTSDYVLKTDGSGNTSWTDTIEKANKVYVAEAADDSNTTLNLLGVASSTPGHQEAKMDADGLTYQPQLNMLSISNDVAEGNYGGWNACLSTTSPCLANYTGETTAGGTWGMGMLEFKSVSDANGTTAGFFRLATNAAETTKVTYILPSNSTDSGKVLRIKADGANPLYDDQDNIVKMLEWADAEATSVSCAPTDADVTRYITFITGAQGQKSFNFDDNARGLTYNPYHNRLTTGNLVLNGGEAATPATSVAINSSTVSDTVNLFNDNTGQVNLGGTGKVVVGSQTVDIGGATYLTRMLGNATVAGTFGVTNTSTFTGAANFNNNVALGNLTSHTIAFNGRVSTDVLPNSASARSLGSTSLAWSNGYINSITATNGLGLNAGGTNQDITLTPSGTGVIVVGGTSKRITGLANLTASSAGTDAANKNYVDAVAQGIHFHEAARAATTANLTANYNNGTSGVGAFLEATVNGTLPQIDGVTLVATNRVLVKNQSSGSEFQNGIYYVDSVGSAGTKWKLIRTTDFDSGVEIAGGDFVFVTEGTNQGGTAWVQTVEVATIGSGGDNILFTQFSGAGAYTADEVTLTKSGNQFAIKNTYVGQNSITTLGTIVTGTWNGGVIGLTYGGTGKALTATNGGIVYSDADSLEITAAGTSGDILTSGGAGAPTWTNPTSGTLTVARANTVKQTLTTAANTYYLTFTDNNTDAAYEDIRVNSNLTYNPNLASYSLGSTSVSNVAVMTVGSSGTGYVDAIVDGGTY